MLPSLFIRNVFVIQIKMSVSWPMEAVRIDATTQVEVTTVLVHLGLSYTRNSHVGVSNKGRTKDTYSPRKKRWQILSSKIRWKRENVHLVISMGQKEI